MKYLGLCLFYVVMFPLLAVGQEKINTKPLETLVWSYADFAHLRLNAAEWKSKKGVDGFIFCYVKDRGPVRWDSGPEKVNHVYAELGITLAELKKENINANFVQASMDDPKWDWFDEARLAASVETFRALGTVARETGCRGVAIDSESYSGKTWDPRSYSEEQRRMLGNQIRKTAAAISAAILEVFPECEILILPEGAYIAMENSPYGHTVYEHWMDFFNGIASTKPVKGLNVLCENTYHVTDPLAAAIMLGKLKGYIQAKAEDVTYWRNQCHISLGSGILDGAMKKSAFSPSLFAVQWETFAKLSSRYRWIYAGSAGFFQLSPESDVPGGERIADFFIPVADEAEDYFSIIRDSPMRLKD